jgi:excisionase family DNA binding protein
MPKLYTMNEVAEILRVTRRQVTNIVGSKALASILLSPRARRVSKEDLDAYLASRRKSLDAAEG